MQATKMSEYAAISTNGRKDKIMNLLTHFSHNDNSTIKAFGVQLAPNFVKINDRILQPPQLEYFNGKIVRPSDGAWKLASIKFLETSKASQGHKWAIIFEKKSRSSISFHKVVDFKKAVREYFVAINIFSHIFESFIRLVAKNRSGAWCKFGGTMQYNRFSGN